MLLGVQEARNAAQNIRPSARTAYLDKVQLWLKAPLSRGELRYLEEQCRGRIHYKRRRAKWDRKRRYQCRLQLRQPEQAALLFLSRLLGVHLNQVEISLDLTFDHQDERDEAYDFVTQLLVKRWHGNQVVCLHSNTRYTGPRKAPTNLVSYCDKHNRLTGELFCVHIEWRLNGIRAVQRAGIGCVADLLELNYRQFWENRLLFRAIALAKLGREYNVQVLKKGRRRGLWWRTIRTRKGQICNNLDAQTGYVVARTTGCRHKRTLGSTQALIDTYGKAFDVNRCLVAVDVSHLLPTA